MRAVVYDRYGPPDVLRIEDVPKPAPGPGQVLVKVAATSINLTDWGTLRRTSSMTALNGSSTRTRGGSGLRTHGLVLPRDRQGSAEPTRDFCS